MVRVYGVAKLKVPFNVEIDMSEEEFYSLSEREQDQLMDEAIDWESEMKNSTVDEFDVWDIES